ncbi:MAG: 1-acyl-sn-glycerol-3-phosphate acyltransferase [Prevotellaceae bacterium]|nr:1-acyl-sn-glycerol-3-phosphate acyltransferase [Prevotellaceae bacterium]
MLIDIDRIIDEKAGKKARRIPRFVRAYLKHIVHQDEINAFLQKEGERKGVEWVDDALEFLDMTLDVEGLENLPDDNARHFTFVSNHPLGGIDGIALGSILGHRYGGRIKYLVNDLLMNLPGLAPLCVPINKTGKQSRDFPAMVEAAFASDNHIIMFPAGLCSRRRGGVVRDLPWQKTFVTKSVATGRDIVPIRFEGENSPFFYHLANLSRLLGIRFNIAMLYLADEMFRNRGKCFKVRIGTPIPAASLDRSKTPRQWAAHIQNLVYSL